MNEPDTVRFLVFPIDPHCEGMNWDVPKNYLLLLAPFSGAYFRVSTYRSHLLIF